MSKNLGDPRPSQLPKTRSTIKMPKTTKVTPPKGRTLREGQEPERPVTILGEIPNMQGHAIFIDIHSKEIHIGMHIENFKELSEDEV